MTSKQFLSLLDNEISEQGFYNEIEEIMDHSVRTVMRFKNRVDLKLALWLNKRFSNGIGLYDNDSNIAYVNTPNDGRGMKEHLNYLRPATTSKDGKKGLLYRHQWSGGFQFLIFDSEDAAEFTIDQTNNKLFIDKYIKHFPNEQESDKTIRATPAGLA